MTNFWHPFADMSKVASASLAMARGDGPYVFDADGRRYLDGTASLWYCNVGHGRGELVEAAERQMRQLAAYSTFGEFTNAAAEELATRVCELSPMGAKGAAFFTSGGSDAIDTAAKLTRRYWTVRGEPQRTTIIARAGAYHGVNGFGTSLGGLEANSLGYGPLVADVVHVPHDNVGALDAAVRQVGERLAGVIGEPVLGAAGVRLPPERYWDEVGDIVRRSGALLILDEVITGFGRLGYGFASERYGVEPDLIVGAKGITSGYLPLGVVIAAHRVRDALWSEDVGLIRHGYTYSGHATACAVGIANLAVLEDEELCAHVRRYEANFTAMLEQLAGHPLVKEGRGVGYMGAIELDEQAIAARPGLVDEAVRAARRHGLLVRNLLGHSIQISPPLIVGPEVLASLGELLWEAICEVGAGLGTATTGAVDVD